MPALEGLVVVLNMPALEGLIAIINIPELEGLVFPWDCTLKR